MDEKMLKEGVKYSIYYDNYLKILRFYGDRISYEYDEKYNPTPDVLEDKGEHARIILHASKKDEINNPFFRTLFQLDALEEAVRFYAEPTHYQGRYDSVIMQEQGKRAQEALQVYASS